MPDMTGDDNEGFGTTSSKVDSYLDSTQTSKGGNIETSPTTAQSVSTPVTAINMTITTTAGKHMDIPAIETPSNTKARPRRAMVLSGMPAPVLPPRPVFPTDLEKYQAQGHANGLSPQYNALVQGYIASLRKDYEKQLKEYEDLKNSIKDDKFFINAIVDELDALDEDPFTLDSFENLMRLHASKNKDFILARVTTQDPNDETKLYHSYYGAHQINKVLFRTQPDEGLLHRMKARNPLNNMLVVGDVHYYIISAEEMNAIKPLSTPHSSSSSVSSHSSRMSRCSKLAAQAIASQSASERSSPILGADMSLFSQSSEVESLESIIPPLMTMSILKADQEDGNVSNPVDDPQSDSANHNSFPFRTRRGSAGSNPSSTHTSTPFIPQNGFQPCKPSRLRQAINPIGQESSYKQKHISYSSSSQYIPQDMVNQQYNSMSLSGENSQASHQSHNQSAQSPLFQSLMGDRIRSQSSSASSTSCDRCLTSLTFSSYTSIAGDDDQDDILKCGSNTSDADSYNTSVESPMPSSPSSTSSSDSSRIESVTYSFRYLASDDDFLLRSSVRQVFKVNALESWDAILFTISNNALREYSGQGGEQALQPLQPLQQQQQQQQNQENEQEVNNTEDSDSDPETLLHQNNSQGHSHANDTSSTQPQSPAGDTIHEDINRSQNDISSGMFLSTPSLISSTGVTQPTPATLYLSSSSSSISTSSSSTSSYMLTSGVSRLSKHDSGHSSTSSLPSASFAGGSRVGARTGRPRRPTSSTVLHFGATGEDNTQDRKDSGGRKLRRALSKIFSIS
ncbi:hypothetical protein BGZ49_010025 [Haplosporangium sp. Z 27]|nr:hypothetical protein BGZ49_010025 [Haplosporangium sp. Z 27]